MTGFSKEALEKGIEKSDANILIFEEAIRKERDQQKEWREMIKTIERKEKEAAASKIELKAD